MHATAEAAEKLRAERHLRPLESAEQGTPVRDLPPGVYGFTWSPSFESSPLFAKHSWRSFEFHKLADGSAAIVGCVSAADAAHVREESAAKIMLYPEPWQDAQELVSIPLERMGRSARTPLREQGCPYPIDLL